MQNAVAECLLSPWVRHQERVPSAEEIGGGIQGRGKSGEGRGVRGLGEGWKARLDASGLWKLIPSP